MAQLKAFVVKRDELQNILEEKVVGKFAVVTNEEAETTEVIRTRLIEIEAMMWSREKGVFQLQISLGGVSNAGVFYRHPKYETALVSWHRERSPELWARYNLDDIDGLKIDNVKEWLHAEDAVFRAGRDIWNIQGLESQWNGLYTRVPVPVIPPPDLIPIK